MAQILKRYDGGESVALDVVIDGLVDQLYALTHLSKRAVLSTIFIKASTVDRAIDLAVDAAIIDGILAKKLEIPAHKVKQFNAQFYWSPTKAVCN